MSTDFFTNKRILITGAANGLGRLLAVELSSLGAVVIAWDRDESGLKALQASCYCNTGPVSCYTVDVSDRDNLKRSVLLVMADFGGIDILINNAGVVSGKPFLEISDAEMERTFAVNTLAPFRLTQALLPNMIEQGAGHVVTIASAGGIVGASNLTDYCASKFAAFGFDDALRLELKRNKIPIRTTVVCPFFFRSDMFAGVRTRFPWLLPILPVEKVVKRTIRSIRLQRRRLILPWFVYSTFLVRLLPVPVFDWAAAFFGITKSMDKFVGRHDAIEE